MSGEIDEIQQFYEGRGPHGATLADPPATCDRCVKPSDTGVIDRLTVRFYCYDCLTEVEKRCLDLGASPFELES